MEQKKHKDKLPRKRVAVIRTMAVREGSVLYGGRCIRNPREAVELIQPFLKFSDKEKVYVCCLDGKSQPVSIELVAMGTADQCLVGMREIFKNAVLVNAVSMIVFHNHPSGNIEPSQKDIDISRKMKRAGDILDIQVLDHIIVGQDAFYSLGKRLEWENWTGNQQALA